MGPYNHFSFIDQLTNALLEDKRSGGKKALARLKKLIKNGEAEGGQPSVISRGIQSPTEVAYSLIVMDQVPDGFSRDNLMALGQLLKEDKRTFPDKDSLLDTAHQIALAFMGAVAPSKRQKAFLQRIGRKYGAQISGQKRAAKAKEELAKRIAWTRSYIKKYGSRNARKAIEAEFGVSPRTASSVLSNAKKVCN